MKPAQTAQLIDIPHSWSEIPWGEYYRAALERQLEPWWPKLFGYHLLKLGPLSAEIATDKCAISHQINAGYGEQDVQVVVDPCYLPFAPKSVDACLLAHTLCYSGDPHRILREVDRILIDDGWVILSGFNPVSLLGMGKLLPYVRGRQPYVSRMFTLMRVVDWLHVLNFEVLHLSRFQVLPWSRKGGEFLSRHLPALGCESMIVARKRTIPLTPMMLKGKLIRPGWRRAVGATKSFRDRP